MAIHLRYWAQDTNTRDEQGVRRACYVVLEVTERSGPDGSNTTSRVLAKFAGPDHRVNKHLALTMVKDLQEGVA